MARRLICASLAMATGCAAPMVQRIHVTSTQHFDPAQRRAVWGRAVMSFQIRGSFVDLSDPAGGVLKSETQPTSARCSNGASYRYDGKECSAYEITQFSLTDDGTAFLRIGRAIWGDARPGETLLSEHDGEALQAKCDQMLQYIVGKSSTPPEAPPPPAQAPSQPPPPGLSI
jgi:hypothetical protein